MKPFMNMERWKSPIEASIAFKSSCRLGRIVPCLKEVVKSVSRQISAQCDLNSNALLSTSYKLHEVTLVRCLVIRSNSDVRKLLSLLQEANFRLPKLNLTINSKVYQQALNRLLRRLLGVADQDKDSEISSLIDLTLTCTSVSDQIIGAVCSLLPFARSLQTLRLDFVAPKDISPAAPDNLWRWLDYSVHHLDTKSHSSWRNLVLEGHFVSPETLATLQPLLQEKDTWWSYRQVRVRRGAIIRKQPREISSSLSRLGEDTSLHRGFKVTQTPGWDCIVLPGLGYGWVRQSHIIKIEEMSQPIPERSLSALRWIHAGGDPFKQDMAVVTMLVELFGRGLRYLDATTFQRANADHVHRILSAAPVLQSICINHDGSYWLTSDAKRFKRSPLALRELWLFRTKKEVVYHRKKYLKPSCLD